MMLYSNVLDSKFKSNHGMKELGVKFSKCMGREGGLSLR